MQSGFLRAFRGAEQVLSRTNAPLQELRNFLLLEHSLALGTAIHGTPVIAALHAVLPEARIISAASGFGLGIHQGHPELERLIAMPSPLRDLRGAVKALRAARPFGSEPYAVLQSTGNGRTRVALASALSGGHVRVGFCVHPELMRAPLEFDGRVSQIANNLRMVDALGHGELLRQALVQEPELAEPAIFPSDKDKARVQQMLREAGLSSEAPLAIFMTQTSPTQRKGWRPERFRAVAAMLGREYGAQIAFGGAAAEVGAIETLREGLPLRTANLAGKTTLLEMSALFGLADVALTLDTGPMHLGRAMRTPMVVIAPAWSPPVEWLPVGNPRVRILKNLTMDAAPADYVIDEVSVQEVEAALRALLREYPPQARAH